MGLMEIDVSGQSRADATSLNWPLLGTCRQRGLFCCCGGLLGGQAECLSVRETDGVAVVLLLVVE